jgi:hypothetical protein
MKDINLNDCEPDEKVLRLYMMILIHQKLLQKSSLFQKKFQSQKIRLSWLRL